MPVIKGCSHKGFLLSILLLSCHLDNKEVASTQAAYDKGSFGYDLQFLQKHDSVVVLQSNQGTSQIIISPKYQAKVFTSTANGLTGQSFGWIDYKTFSLTTPDAHMNAYGGEDRLWLGPEGGKFSLFFTPGSKMIFDNWHTPPAVDKEPWSLDSATKQAVFMSKTTELVNYAGTDLHIKLERVVKMLETPAIEQMLGIELTTTVKSVGFTTLNTIINTGDKSWDAHSGMPCLWNLDMFSPSAKMIIVVPYNDSAAGKIATTDYFGQIPPDRVKFINGFIYFKADGKARGKMGVPPLRAKTTAGSYDAEHQVLTVALFIVDPAASYLNQEWRTDKPPFSGDAVNAYNDGPLADGSQMGPFLEIESVSPAAFLAPGQRLSHVHSVFHFTGDTTELNKIALKTLGVSLQNIQHAF